MNSITTSTCQYCKEIKLIEFFVKDSKFKTGFNPRKCKSCKNIYDKKHKKKNRDHYLNYKREWRKKNREKYLESKRKSDKKYRNKPENKERIKAQIKECNKKRINNDLNYKLRRRLSNRINMAVKHGQSIKMFKTTEVIGCSLFYLKSYIESKFLPNMSWDNYGKGSGKWHIDHILPCSLFDLTNPEHQKKCFHYTNLQPLWEDANFSKTDYLLNGKRAGLLSKEEKLKIISGHYQS